MKKIANVLRGLRNKSAMTGFLLVFAACGMVSMNAQVTIGSLDDPAKGALLELKTQTNPGGATSDKGGLLLPRVQLQSLTSLQPFIANETPQDKLEHIGLEVYNIADNGTFTPGIYYWNGTQWKSFGGSGGGTATAVIHLPSFNLDWAANTTKSVNLYEVYSRNFTTSVQPLISSNPALTSSSALTSTLGVAGDYDYVVTDYDTSCITIQSISTSGVMTYDCTTTAPTATTYLNIILIKK